MTTTETVTKKKPRTIEGKVISDKMDKTRVIETKRSFKHGLYGKSMIRKSRLMVHDEKNESKTGDVIQAAATRPLSRHKSFRLIKILEKRVVS